jgi:hypothetical protein
MSNEIEAILVCPLHEILQPPLFVWAENLVKLALPALFGSQDSHPAGVANERRAFDVK